MSFHADSEIERIVAGLAARTLPKCEWTHAAHWAAAFWLLSHHGDAALQQMPGLIRAYNEAVGVANTATGGYHETITRASLRAARAWLAAHAGEPLHRSLESLLAAEYGRPDWLLAYWSRAVLFSVEARCAWVPPDLQALPFP
jgi:hypothetical protein